MPTVTGPNTSVFTLNVNTSDGADTVTVLSAQHPLTIDTGSEANTVTLGGATGAHDDREHVIAEPGGQAVGISFQVELGDACWSRWVGDGRRARQADARCPFDEEGQ